MPTPEQYRNAEAQMIEDRAAHIESNLKAVVAAESEILRLDGKRFARIQNRLNPWHRANRNYMISQRDTIAKFTAGIVGDIELISDMQQLRYGDSNIASGSVSEIDGTIRGQHIVLADFGKQSLDGGSEIVGTIDGESWDYCPTLMRNTFQLLQPLLVQREQIAKNPTA